MKIFPLILLVFLGACATTGEKMKRLSEGMSKDEVTQLMGRPDGFRREGEFEAMKYTHRLVTGWAWDRADYNVILKNGRVVEYGAGEVRVKAVSASPILFLVPLP